MTKIKLDYLKVKSFLTDLTKQQKKLGGCPAHTGEPCYISAGNPVCY
jgi:hypothetical protein